MPLTKKQQRRRKRRKQGYKFVASSRKERDAQKAVRQRESHWHASRRRSAARF